MKPKQKKPKTVFRIIDKDNGKPVGSYSPSHCYEYDFKTVHEARTANCNDKFRDEDKYKIAKYKVTYELIEDDCQVEEEYQESYEEGKPVTLKSMFEYMIKKQRK